MEQPSWIKRSFPTFIRLLPVLVVILILLVVVHAVLNVVLHRRVEIKLAEIKRTGGAMTLSELVPDPVPDWQNAAVHYFYALSIMERALWEDEGCSETIVEAFEILWPLSMSSQKRQQVVSRDLQAPPASDASGNKVPDLSWSERQQRERAIEAAREYLENVQPGVDADGREIEVAARHIFKSEKMARGLQVVKDARELGRAQLLSDYDLAPDVVAELILPYLARFRALSRWVASTAVLAAWDGDMDEAFDLVSSGLHIANSLRNEPFLIAQFVRVAVAGNAINGMQEVLDEKYPPDEHVAMIVAELDKLRDRDPFVRGLQGERCFVIALDRRLPMAAKYVAGPILLLDKLAYLEYMSDVIDLKALPAYQSRDALEKLTDQLSTVSKLKVRARLVIPVFARAEAQDRLVAQCDLAEMAMYLKQYKKKTGSYPEKLDAIVPEYIQELPVDPFTGTRYIYRKEGDGFVLYSVSVNLVDNGGKPDYMAGDIVWRSSR